jgi:hypothetical protein
MKKKSSLPSATVRPISAGQHPILTLYTYPEVTSFVPDDPDKSLRGNHIRFLLFSA